MNHKQIYKKINNFLEAYIAEYLKKNAEVEEKTNLANLRSWSSLGNGISVYINGGDLLPEFALESNPYASVRVFGLEVNISQGKLGDVTVQLTSGEEYGLPDVEAIIDYAIANVDKEKLDAKLSDFFSSNIIQPEGGITASSIKEKAALEVKAELLDGLLGRSVAFGKKD